jgi:plasmid stabilization system protein ParE
MPRVIVTEGAARGLRRCRSFLINKAPEAADRAAQAIDRKLLLLETMPAIGRNLSNTSYLRELIIKFGDSGFVILYRHAPADDIVYVVSVRHQKEGGY